MRGAGPGPPPRRPRRAPGDRDRRGDTTTQGRDIGPPPPHQGAEGTANPDEGEHPFALVDVEDINHEGPEQAVDKKADDALDDKAGDEVKDQKKDDQTSDDDAESPAALKQRLEKAEKALKDTQHWGHTNAADKARLQRELDDLKRNSDRPDILDSLDGLEDAIKHVTGAPAAADDNGINEQSWSESVTKVHSDRETLLDTDELSDISEEMPSDDAADAIGELATEQADEVLGAMEEE